MLTTLAIAALLGGYVFGMRFKVYVLIPAILLNLLNLLVVVTIGLALESAIPAILAAAILTVTGLQVGYFAATAITFMLPRGVSSHEGLQKLRWGREH